jgi:hypothetical protein
MATTINKVTPEAVSAFKQRIESEHHGKMDQSPDPTKSGHYHGQIQTQGYLIDYEYWGAQQRMDINVKHRPLFHRVAHIESALADELGGALEAAQTGAGAAAAQPPA